MSTRWVVGMAALLSCHLVDAAAADQPARPEAARPGEASTTEGAPPAARDASAKELDAQGTAEFIEKHLKDPAGKPVRISEAEGGTTVLDSKGKPIPFKDVPLGQAFVCYPPPKGAQPGTKSAATTLPRGSRCGALFPERDGVLRVLLMACPPGTRPCVIPNHPWMVGCCR